MSWKANHKSYWTLLCLDVQISKPSSQCGNVLVTLLYSLPDRHIKRLNVQLFLHLITLFLLVQLLRILLSNNFPVIWCFLMLLWSVLFQEHLLNILCITFESLGIFHSLHIWWSYKVQIFTRIYLCSNELLLSINQKNIQTTTFLIK